jgi:hypothetical protein
MLFTITRAVCGDTVFAAKPHYMQGRKYDLKLKILEATDRLKLCGILKMEAACSSETFLPSYSLPFELSQAVTFLNYIRRVSLSFRRHTDWPDGFRGFSQSLQDDAFWCLEIGQPLPSTSFSISSFINDLAIWYSDGLDGPGPIPGKCKKLFSSPRRPDRL